MTSRVQHQRRNSGKHSAASIALALAVLLQAPPVIAQPQTHHQAFTYEVLYTFAGGVDGGVPVANLVFDNAGKLYGTTEYRGTSDWGVVFKLDTTGKETVLHSFTGEEDGATPRAGLVLDSAGNLYGTALQGGPPCGLFTCGVVFKMDSTGNETVLHGFTGADGANPEAGLFRDSAGNLYGTTSAGGSGYGVVFKLDATTNKETLLYRFTGRADGGQPMAGLVSDSAGNLYGTTQGGGNLSACVAGCGVVFKLDPTGMQTVLYTFTGGSDGRYPSGDLIQDSAGNLYGNTWAGGASCISSGEGCGVVFKLNPTTGEVTVLYTFTGGADGAFPGASLFLDDAGILYGTTPLGGASGGCGGGGCGVVFSLDPTTGKETVLYTFTGGADGGQPAAGLIQDSAGNFYGTAGTAGISGNCGIGCGVVFKLTATQASFNVSVVLAGDGSGTVTSSPAGINCPTTCSANFVNGSTVALTATADADSTFSGWSGDCSGAGGCTVTASASATATFDALPPDFSVTPTSTSLTVQPGGQATDTIIVAPQNGIFGNEIQLACTVAGQSPMPTCALSPVSVTPGANSATSTLTIAAPASAMLESSVGRHLLGLLFAVWVPLATIAMISIGATKKERRRRWMSWVFLSPLLLALAGCGGSNVTQHGPTNYTVTVTGTSSPIQHTTQVTVTVQ